MEREREREPGLFKMVLHVVWNIASPPKRETLYTISRIV